MNVTDALHQTVHAYPGGPEALAVRLGMQAQVLRNKANPRSSSNRASLEDLDQILGITGDHRVLHALAHNHGYVCMQVQEDASASDMAVLELVTKIWAASGVVGAEVHATLADGIVEPHEVERVQQAVYSLYGALGEMVSRLKGMTEPAQRSA
jgi:hypothetical protein